MHAAFGVVAGVLGLTLAGVLHVRDGFSRLAGDDASADGFDLVVLGPIVVVLGCLGLGAVLGGVFGRAEGQRGATLALAVGAASLSLLGYALLRV
jgi:hypothetical protein